MTRHRVILLRGHEANRWDLRPWEQLLPEYDIAALVTGSNVHQLAGLGIPMIPTGSPRDVLPRGRATTAAAYVIGERYFRLEERLRGAKIVHAAEIGSWFSAQAALLKEKLGFRLVVSVWETLPWRETYRWPRERRYRRDVLAAVDLFLAATARAGAALALEGVPRSRIEVCPPGIDISRFAPRPARHPAESHDLLPVPRWEEQFGMVLAGAMASGTPIVASACGAIPEVLQSGGQVVPAGDWLALAKALERGPLARKPGARVVYDPVALNTSPVRPPLIGCATCTGAFRNVHFPDLESNRNESRPMCRLENC